ncbi:NADPH:quinone reductase [Pleurotus ostreatus]|nr:NADPH:quinone reductase [Pleurotus ostreatus]
MTSIPNTIEAIAIAKTGDFDVLEKMTLPFKPAPEEIVVKVSYCGVNFVDTYFRKGLYPIGSFPAVLGGEAAGTIVALPTDQNVLNDPNYQVRNFVVGSKVAVNSLRSHSNYVAKAYRFVYPVPSSVSTLEAAAGLVQSLTAVSFMDEAYTVKKGDTLLIHTAAGGLGLLLTQYAKHIGATVIGTTSTPEKAALAKINGADYVILYKNENTVQRVLELTNGEGVDAIFDGVGKDTFDADFEMIKRKGTIVSLGNASGPVPPFPPLKLVQKNVKLLRPTVGNYTYTPSESLHYGNKIFDLISKGVLKLRIYKEYPFTAQGAQQAQRDLTGGVSTGKLVLDVSRVS